MKKTVFILMIVTIVSKALGFGRDIILSYFYGASRISDVYLISLTIPSVLIALLGRGISVGFVPMYTRIEGSSGTERANQYANYVANLVLIICTFIFLVGIIFTEQIVKGFASGFEGETLKLAVNFTRITLAGVFFTGLFNVFGGYLQVKKIFIIPALMGIPANLIAIGSIYASFHTNIYVLSIGALISIFSQFLLLVLFGYKSNYKFRIELNYKDENIRKMAVLAVPAVLGTSVFQINVLIDRTLASRIVEGGITALDLANTINGIIIGIFVLSINTVLYPKISRLAADNNLEKLKKTLLGGINAINIMVMPAAVGLMVFSEQIVRFLYGRGHFDLHAISLTSYALFFFTIGLVSLSHREILSNTFYSLQDTKTPMINSAMAMGLNVVLNLVLSRPLGIGGIALATSISTIFCTFSLLFKLRKKIGNLGLKSHTTAFIKVLVASLVMGGLSKLIYAILIKSMNSSYSLVVSVLFGFFVYFVLIYLLKIKEVNVVVLEMKARLMKTKGNEIAKL